MRSAANWDDVAHGDAFTAVNGITSRGLRSDTLSVLPSLGPSRMAGLFCEDPDLRRPPSLALGSYGPIAGG